MFVLPCFGLVWCNLPCYFFFSSFGKGSVYSIPSSPDGFGLLKNVGTVGIVVGVWTRDVSPRPVELTLSPFWWWCFEILWDLSIRGLPPKIHFWVLVQPWFRFHLLFPVLDHVVNKPLSIMLLTEPCHYANSAIMVSSENMNPDEYFLPKVGLSDVLSYQWEK